MIYSQVLGADVYDMADLLDENEREIQLKTRTFMEKNALPMVRSQPALSALLV